MAALFLIQNFSFLLGVFSRMLLCRKAEKNGPYFYLECLAGGGQLCYHNVYVDKFIYTTRIVFRGEQHLCQG